MKLELLNQSAKYPPAQLVDPPTSGYLHLAAAVAPPSGPPVVRASERRSQVLAQLKTLAAALAEDDRVRAATVYRAVVVPPAVGYARQPRFHRARYDVAVLVEAESLGQLEHVEETDACQALVQAVAKASDDTLAVRERCIRSLKDVDRSQPGLFLFNHWVCEDVDVAVELWEKLAGWYVRTTGLDNSLLLQPVQDADYALVNHARWDLSAPSLFLRQVIRPAFRTYVQDNLLVNRVGVMPVLYRLA